MNFKWHSAFAQAWDTPGTVKFITRKKKYFYEMIDRFYQLEQVNKNGCRYTVLSAFVATVHRWVNGYENTQSRCGSPIDGYMEAGNWTNLWRQNCKQGSRVLTGEKREDDCSSCKAVRLYQCTRSAATLCQFKTENRVLDSSRHCYTAENRHGSIRESLFPVCPMLDGV